MTPLISSSVKCDRSIRTVCVYCGSSDQSPTIYHEAATRLGLDLARRGLTIVYGGASIGSMGRLANAALSAGGRVVGVLPRFMDELEWGHKSLTELHLVTDLRERKRLMLEMSDAVVVLPGGSGTLEELFEAITLKRLGLYLRPIVLVNINGFFDSCVQMLSQCINDRFMHEKHSEMWWVVADPSSVFRAMQEAPQWNADAIAFATQL